MRRTVRKFNLNDWFEERFGPMQRVFFSFVEILVDNQPARWWLTMDVDRKNWARHNHWKGKRKWHWQQFLTIFVVVFLKFFTLLRKPPRNHYEIAPICLHRPFETDSQIAASVTRQIRLCKGTVRNPLTNQSSPSLLSLYMCVWAFYVAAFPLPSPFFEVRPDLFVIRIIYSHWFVQSKRS